MFNEKLRRVENLHIFFWLFKDLCWISDFHVLAVTMIVPTLSVAIWMAWKFRFDKAELAHNMAIILWVCANSTWMIGEFFFNDSIRPFAKVFFISGVIVLAVHYLSLPFSKKNQST